MKNYRCDECGAVSEHSDLIKHTDETGSYNLCPVCESEELEKVHPCPICGEYTPDDYCEDCNEKLTKEIGFAILSLNHWDRELLREKLVEYVEAM